MTGETIVCISSIDWDFVWQGHQEIMTALAARGNRLLFVENTGVRAPTLGDLSRVRQRARNWWRRTATSRLEQANLVVYSPLALPFPYSRLALPINRTIVAHAIRRWLRAVACARPIVWTYLPTPLVLDLFGRLNPELTVYYCVDDLSSSSPGAGRILPSEVELLRTADFVFVTAERLRQRAAQVRSGVHVFPSGVSHRRFERIRISTDPGPADVRNLPRPIVGFIGSVTRWINQELLGEVAGRMREATFVFVGPVQTDVSRLEVLPNVHFLGPRPSALVPHYIKAFDVGVIPYRLTEYTSHVYPAKLNEYLAMGLPVVATNLYEVQRFNAEHGPVVYVGEDATTFEEALRQALHDGLPAAVERRIEIARQNDWERRIGRMLTLIEDELRQRRNGGRP